MFVQEARSKKLAASLGLKADNVNCWTLFCATHEYNPLGSCNVQMLKVEETDTKLMLRPLNKNSCVFRNKVATEIEGIELQKEEDFDF